MDGCTDSHFFACQANSQPALVHGLLLPVQLQGQEQSPVPPTATPQQLLCPWSHQHHPPWGLLCVPVTRAGLKNLHRKQDGTFLTQPTPLSQRRSLLHFAPFSAQQRRKILEEEGLSSCEISKSNDKHMEVCPARAHPPVQILGQVTWCLASSFKRALFIYSSQEFGALFFNLPTSFTSSCSACSPRAFFFLPLTLPVLDDYYINRDSS